MGYAEYHECDWCRKRLRVERTDASSIGSATSRIVTPTDWLSVFGPGGWETDHVCIHRIMCGECVKRLGIIRTEEGGE